MQASWERWGVESNQDRRNRATQVRTRLAGAIALTVLSGCAAEFRETVRIELRDPRRLVVESVRPREDVSIDRDVAGSVDVTVATRPGDPPDRVVGASGRIELVREPGVILPAPLVASDRDSVLIRYYRFGHQQVRDFTGGWSDSRHASLLGEVTFRTPRANVALAERWEAMDRSRGVFALVGAVFLAGGVTGGVFAALDAPAPGTLAAIETFTGVLSVAGAFMLTSGLFNLLAPTRHTVFVRQAPSVP